MKISLSPQRRDDALTVVKAGDTLTINGAVYDFSVIPDGATLPADAVDCSFIAGPVERVAGDLQLTLILPLAGGASEAARFPQPLIDPTDGTVELPQ